MLYCLKYFYKVGSGEAVAADAVGVAADAAAAKAPRPWKKFLRDGEFIEHDHISNRGPIGAPVRLGGGNKIDRHLRNECAEPLCAELHARLFRDDVAQND